MLENFIFSANAVFPIFLVIAMGYFLRQKQFISVNAIGEMNRLVFTFALPALLFRNIYQADFTALLDTRFILWILGSIIISFILLWAFAEFYLRKQKDLIGAFVQATLRSNYAIVGLPLVANIMESQDTGMGALAAAFVVTSYNIFSVIVLTAKDSQNGPLDFKLVKNMFVGICKNPSVIGIACGVALNLLHVQLPFIAEAGINYIAILCTPMALIAVGGSIQVSELMGYLKPALTASALKIIVTPLIFIPISVWLGFRGEALAVLLVMFANPTAIICYVMAARMNGNTAITSATILITTVFSSITLTIGVYLLRTLAFF
ncbi:MAG: AEC family transporter [Defluviitaleaceae bacterium]|nr:AEC family transporter [Defluviitaleaceae bacterium]